MKVLVTGGGGFLGTAICRQLQSAGYEVAAFQRSPAPHLEAIGIESRQGDICDISQIQTQTVDCDAIIHAAGKAGIWGAFSDYQNVNVNGTKNVIEVCRNQSIEYLVYTSTPSVVHAGHDIEGGDESLPIADRFSAFYPATKARAEHEILAANDGVLKTLALRPHLIWGPGDPHLLPRLTGRIRRGRIKLPGASKLIDTTYVDNAARAHVQALDGLQDTECCAGKVYFISNRQPLPQGEIISKLLAAAGHEKVIIDPVNPRLALLAGSLVETCWRLLRIGSEPWITRFAAEQLVSSHWYDCSAAERDFGWKPHISIDEGLRLLSKSKNDTRPEV
jgi:nucleoside-diphosphate-sugar epimerase